MLQDLISCDKSITRLEGIMDNVQVGGLVTWNREKGSMLIRINVLAQMVEHHGAGPFEVLAATSAGVTIETKYTKFSCPRSWLVLCYGPARNLSSREPA